MLKVLIFNIKIQITCNAKMLIEPYDGWYVVQNIPGRPFNNTRI